MAEMHVFGSQGADFPDRLAPGVDVAGLAGREVAAAGFGVLPGRVGRVADEQVERPIPAHDDALVALGVAGVAITSRPGSTSVSPSSSSNRASMKPNHSYNSDDSRRIRLSSARCT
jgi:hypothetical protein